MSKLRTATVALLSAAALAGSALMAPSADAAARASVAVLKTPKKIRANAASADVTVTYKCRNDATSIYYIRARLSQDGTNILYGRGDTDSPVFERLRATCNGKKVTETIALYSYGSGPKTMAKGKGVLEFDLYSLAPPPGSAYGQRGTGPEVFTYNPVKVTVSR
jgi:hypothetical protein